MPGASLWVTAGAVCKAAKVLNRTARDSYTHAPEPECRSVRYAHENSGVQGRRAHSARYTECANLMHLGLEQFVFECTPVLPWSAQAVLALSVPAAMLLAARG